MSVPEIQYQTLTTNLEEVNDPLDPLLDPEQPPRGLIMNRLQEAQNHGPAFRVYWGTAPTGKPHLGYLVPLIKIAEMIRMGFKVKILLADQHALMDHAGTTPKLVQARSRYYQIVLTAMLRALPQMQNQALPEFVLGSSFQQTPEYMSDLIQLMSVTTLKASQKAGSEVVKQNKDPYLSSIVYPLMQALDEKYMQVDAQLGGLDQRKIFMYAHDHLPKIQQSRIAYLMNPLIPGLTKSGKMTSTEPASKIDFDDTDEVIERKVSRAFSVDGVSTGNGLLSITKYIIFPCLDQGLTIRREMQYGGDIHYSTYQDLEADFVAKKVGSVDLKATLSRILIDLIRKVRDVILANVELRDQAYPEA